MLPSFLNPKVPSIGPGRTLFTRIFNGPHSTAKCRVKASKINNIPLIKVLINSLPIAALAAPACA